MNPSLLRNASLLSCLFALSTSAHALVLTPQYAGVYQNGDGANSQWVQVSSDWRGNTYGDQSWGTGIWGLNDQAQVMGLASNDPFVVQTLTTRVAQINFANQQYLTDWSASWGASQLAPIFHNTAGENQDNWASRFTGYIAVTTPGAYNFGVLYDDGFRFSLFGADGSSQVIQKDGLNPRDRLGFAEDLLLSPGLYAYQLDAYDRLEAGVVQLSWITPQAGNWSVVPQDHLFVSPIPEPSVPLLMLAGLATIGLTTRRTRG